MMRAEIVQPGISEYTEASTSFLDSQALTDEVFIVIDNTGYYSALTQVDAAKTTAAVDFQVELTTRYKDNDIYNRLYYGFIGAASFIGLLLVSFLVALKMLRVKYNKLMEQRAEFKKQLVLKESTEVETDGLE